ncbi:MAG: hypothetical protein ABSF68_12010 [Candidatus Acidiferrales bacterium]|jgi:hypothetical protein
MEEEVTTPLLPHSHLPCTHHNTKSQAQHTLQRRRRARPSKKRPKDLRKRRARKRSKREEHNRRKKNTTQQHREDHTPVKSAWKTEEKKHGRRGHHSSPSTLSLSIVHALYPTHEESGHNTSYREGEEHYRTQRGKKSSTEEKENDEESHCTVQEESKDQKDLRREECKGRTQTEHILHDEEERTVHNTDRTARGRAEGSTGEECKGRQHREDTSTDREEECGV